MADNLPKRGIIDRVLSTPRVRAMEAELDAVNRFLDAVSLRDENLMIDQADGTRLPMSEALASVDMMLDAKGWTPIWEYDDIAGLTLRQVKEASVQARELVVGNPFVQNAARVRVAHVLGAGVEFGCRNRTGAQEAKTMPVTIQTLMEEPWFQRYVFGNTSRAENERSAFTDGNFLFLGRDRDKRGQRVQVHEITGYLRNPNNSEEVWAYRRTWNPNPQRTDQIPNVTNPGQEDSLSQRTRWYYTDIFPTEERRDFVKFEGRDERAEPGYTMLDMGFNRQVGWPLGVPDALAIIAWSRLYKEFMVNGYVMSRSLARLAFRLTLGGKKGKEKAAEVSRPGQAGATFLEGEGNTLTPLASAGKGYDFSSGDGLARAMAAGLGISVRALLSDPEGTTQTNFMVDSVAKASAAVRRGEWDDYYLRLFKWMGLTKHLVVTWRDHNDDTVARLMQGLTLLDQLEVVGADVMQRAAARVLDIGDPGAVPEGWLPFSQRKGSSENGTLGKSGSTAGTGQGADNGTGGSGNDTRDQPA